MVQLKIKERHHPDAGHYTRSFYVYDGAQFTAAVAWCTEQFGPGPNDFGKHAPWMSFDRNVLAFHDENLAFAFKLRWC